jgi:hypothetical protein
LSNIKIRSKPLSNPIIVDGISRTGKFFLAKILCGLKDVDYFQYISSIEQIPYLNRLGFIDEKASVSMIQTIIDENSYNQMIGRNINLRFDDASSVTNSFEKELYIKRSNSVLDKSELFKIFNKRYSPFITHETFCNINIFFKAFQSLKVILLKRHPADVVYSWYKRGWGIRYQDNDPLAFMPLLEKNKYYFPWYVNNWENEYSSISEVEKIIKSISVLMRLEQDSFESLSSNDKKKILIISYENLLENPFDEISKIMNFLGKNSSTRMAKILDQEKCPNKISIKNREKKISEISKNSQSHYFDILLECISIYEKRFSTDKNS